MSLKHTLVPLLFLLSHVSFVGDDQCVKLLVWLQAQKLILLSLSEVKKLLDLFLLAHLRLLLLLFEIVLLESVPLEVSLFVLMLAKPLSELGVLTAVISFLDGDHEHCRRVEAENRLA